MNTKEMFASLTQSAFDFLDRACSEIETQPKASVINFCTAAELFLKARLMREHWSLIIEDAKKADVKKFERGDFISIGMPAAFARLESVVGEGLSKDEQRCLNQIREHRNKLVHFYNPAYVGKADPAAIAKVVAEQCRAWYYLHRLFTGRWKFHFKSHLADVEKINSRMHKLRVFLKIKYDAIKPTIDERRAKGTRFDRCGACGFEATGEEHVLGPLYRAECLVCHQHFRFLKIPCPACAKDVIVEDLGEGTCDGCGESVDLEHLLEEYGAHPDPKDDYAGNAYCSNCEEMSHPTAVSIGDELLCLSCLETFDSAGQCDWCNEYVAGIGEDSYLHGCMMCDGMIGHQMSKDD